MVGWALGIPPHGFAHRVLHTVCCTAHGFPLAFTRRNTYNKYIQPNTTKNTIHPQVDAGAALTTVNALLDCLVAHDRACPLTTPTVAATETRAVRAGYLGILPTITADDQDPHPGVKKPTERWLWAYMANRVVDWNESLSGVLSDTLCWHVRGACVSRGSPFHSPFHSPQRPIVCHPPSGPSEPPCVSSTGQCDFRRRRCEEGFLCMGHRYTTSGQVLGTCYRGTTRCGCGYALC